MHEEIILQDLDQRKVNVLIQKSMEVEGTVYVLGGNRCSYINSIHGREQLAEGLPEPYLSAVLAVWGDTPTVVEPAPEPTPETPAAE